MPPTGLGVIVTAPVSEVHDHADRRSAPASSRVGRWLAAPLVLGVKLYQRLLSPLKPSSCRFYPSCSAYAVTSLQRFGPLKGTWLAVRRLGRCNPWNPGGIDHVPDSWDGRHDPSLHEVRIG